MQSFSSKKTYQDIFQFDIPVDESLTMEIPYSLNDVHSYLETASETHAAFYTSVQITLHSFHDEENSWRTTTSVRVVNDRAYNPDYSIMRRNCPEKMEYSRIMARVTPNFEGLLDQALKEYADF